MRRLRYAKIVATAIIGHVPPITHSQSTQISLDKKQKVSSQLSNKKKISTLPS